MGYWDVRCGSNGELIYRIFEKKDSFTALAFGDPQPRDDRERSYFRDDIVPELADTDAREKGIHKITVWTQDMYGQEFTQSKIIEVK